MNVGEAEADQATVAWRSLMRAFSRCLRALRRELEPFGVRPGQARIIRLIGEAGPDGLPLNDLSKRMFVSSANITRLMDRLEEHGHVVRKPDAEDRRVVRAVLTPPGRELLDELAPVYRAWVERCMSCLGDEEQAQMSALLSRLAEHAGAMVGEDKCEG